MGMHRVERSHVKQAATQTRLVGGQHHVKPGVVQATDALERSGQRVPFFG